uniref:Uncharacterized protein n=1 Tax=Wuchereria bancrofti TaxID=6293 RepID=A0A1I8EEU7_WUCBA
MDRYGLLERIRRRILNDENKANNRRSHGVEKVVNKAKKFRITYHEMSPTKNTFEENVLRKAQSIRVKQCCQRLSGCDDENVDIIAKSYNSMPSLYTSKSIFRVDKSQITKAVVDVNEFLRNNKKKSHLLQSTRLRSRNKMDEIKKDKVRQPQIPAIKCENY